MAQRLLNPADSLNEVERGEHASKVGELAFPGVKNPTGHVLDTLKRKGR